MKRILTILFCLTCFVAVAKNDSTGNYGKTWVERGGVQYLSFLGMPLKPYTGTAIVKYGSFYLDTATGTVYVYTIGGYTAITGGGGGSGTVTSITAGAGLSGGTITTSGTISLPTTGTSGTCNFCTVTFDAYGRETARTTGAPVTSVAASSPLTGGTITSTGTIGINDAAADGSTKGASTYTASDFNSSSGLISIDYTNGQSATTSTKGFLPAADWNTFNGKQAALGFTPENVANKATSMGTLNNSLYPTTLALSNYVASFGYGTGSVTSVTAGSGLSGGTITTTGTISMPATGTAGTYGSATQVPVFVTDAQGRVTGVTNTPISAGTVTSVNVVTANGVSGTVATATTTPAITISLGAITPTSVAASGAVSGSNLSGANTGDQTAGTGLSLTAGAFAITTVNATPGTYGSATAIPVVTVNALGQATQITTVTVTPAASSITGTLALSQGGTGATTTTSVNGTPIPYGANTTLAIGTGTVTNVIAGTNISITGTSTIQPTVNVVANPTFATSVTTPTLNATAAIQLNGTNINTIYAPIASPTFTGTVTIPNGGVLGTPTSMTATNITGTAAGLTAGNVTTNANSTGDVTSVGNTTTYNGVVPVAKGGLNKSSAVLYDIPYATSTTAYGAVAIGTAYQLLNVNSGATGYAWTSTLGATGTRLTKIWVTDITCTNAIAADITGNAATVTTIPTISGDMTNSGNAITLNTVNSNVGTFGSATKSVTATVNGKGLVTAISEQTVTPAIGSVTGLGTGVATFLATPSSANLASALTDETGTGAAVFANTPTLVTPVIGAATGTSLVVSSKIDEAKGADIASATTTDIGAATGNYINVTGTTTITGLGTIQAGTERTVKFTGILTLTYNATSLILPTAANIATTAGDVAIFRSNGSGNWLCVSYTRANGTALSGGSASVSIGSSIVSSTTGSALYVDGSLQLAQDNANYYYDATNHRLGFGTTSPACKLDLGNLFNTSNYTYRTGSFLMQPYALNNGFIADNAYFNGAAWTRLSTGYNTGFQFFNGQLMVFVTASGSGTFTQSPAFKVDVAGNGTVCLGTSSTSGGISATSGTFTGANMVVYGAGNVSIGATTDATNGKLQVTGDLNLEAAGNKLKIATGSNASLGSNTMVSGTCTVSTTAVTANSLIFLTGTSTGSPPCATCGVLSVGTITAGSSFVINSSTNTDTRSVNWIIIN